MASRPDAAAVPCACSALRMASRAVSRFYEAGLAPTGTTTTQFSILCYIKAMGPTPLRTIADALVLERTSLYRALAPLERNGLVTLKTDPDDARVKRAYLTRAGVAQVRRVTPAWRRVQTSFLDAVGGDEWRIVSKRLASIRSRVPGTEGGIP